MDNETINLLFKALISLISILITGFAIPWLKNKIGEQKFAKLSEAADLAVRTAEMIFTVDEWQRKKQYAMEYVAGKAQENGLDISAQDLEVLVESAVEYVKYGSTYTKGTV